MKKYYIKVGDYYVQQIIPECELRWNMEKINVVLVDDVEDAQPFLYWSVDLYVRYINRYFKDWKNCERVLIKKYEQIQIT